jgi:hypothetical protein
VYNIIASFGIVFRITGGFMHFQSQFTAVLRPNPKKNMELTITSPYAYSRVDSNTFTMGNPMPESTLTVSLSGTLDLASIILVYINRPSKKL